MMVLYHDDAVALDPPRSRTHLGVGPRFFSGEIGENSNFGLGFGLSQALRWSHFSMDATLSAAYFTTTQPAPPTSRSLIVYSAQFTPKIYYPIGPLEVFAMGGYERVGLAANSLIRITGPELSYNGATVGGGVQWVMTPLEVRLGGQWHWISGLPGQMLSITLSVGFGE